MGEEVIKKMIPACLIETLEERGLSLVQHNDGFVIVPSDSVLLLQNDGISGFLAGQISKIYDKLDIMERWCKEHGISASESGDGIEQQTGNVLPGTNRA